MRRLFLLLLLVSLTGYSQGSGTQVFVVASKTAFIWGERVHVQATVRNSLGVIQNTPVTWSVIPPEAAQIAADGTITPLDFMSFAVQAQANGAFGDVGMQVIPSRIVVKPESDSMTVGSTQKVRAEILDINNSPVPSARLRWYVSNASGNLSSDIPRATIDTAGNLQALVAGRLMVRANIHYEYNPFTLLDFDGAADVQVNPPETYRFTRAFVGEATRGTSVLSNSPSPLIPTNRGFIFTASLDGTGSGILEWTPDGVRPIAIAGRSSASQGQPLVQQGGVASSHGTQFLFSESDTQGASQISAGTTDYTQPLLGQNSPLFGAEQTSFGMSRNSLADRGMKIFSVQYIDNVTHRGVNALYRGYGRGLTESIVNSLDGVPGYEGQIFSIGNYGVADDGTAWFTLSIGNSGAVLFHSKVGSPIEKILALGGSIQNERVASLVPFEDPGGLGVSNNFFAANNGDLLMDVLTDKGKVLIRWNASDNWATPDLLRSTSNGIFWYEPAVGALISGPGNGLYLWRSAAPTPLLQIGDSSLDGSPVQQIYSATATEQGEIYAVIRTAVNPMMIVRLSPDRRVLLKAGDTLPVGAVPVISRMLTGSGTGNPLVIAGGQTGGIAKLKNDGGLETLIPIGQTLPNGKSFGGTQIGYYYKQAAVLPDGSVAFVSNNAMGDGIFVWRNGTIDWQLRLPILSGGATISSWINAFNVNSRGDLVTQMSGDGIYLIRDGKVQKVMKSTETPPNLIMTGLSSPVVNESGRVYFPLFSGSAPYLMEWDGAVSKIILQPGQVLPDGRAVQSIGSFLRTAGTSLAASVTMADGQITFVMYSNGAWQYLVGKADRMASGDSVTYVHNAGDVNARGDLGFGYAGNNYNQAIAARIGNTFHFVQSFSDFTPDGAVLTNINQILMNDDGAMFVLGVNDLGQQVIYKATPEGPGVPYSVSNQGGTSLTAAEDSNSVTTGFGSLQPGNNGSVPNGLAIFQLRQNGVLVTEASVPMTQPVKSGRIYAEINAPVNTGLAIANPNTRQAKVSFFFTDENGKDSNAGSISIAGGAQVAAFLDQPPFNGGATFKGTFTFVSDLPVGAIALRGLLNERSEFLITTLPVSPLSAPVTGTQIMPYFADGLGWTTQILLVNTSDSAIGGTVQFIDHGSDAAAGLPVNVRVNGLSSTTFSYSIPPRSSRRIGTSGGGALITGSVRIVPASGSGAPSVSNVFSYKPGAITVSEAGIPVVPSGRAFRMYAEASGRFEAGEAGSIQSGIAIANPSANAVTVHLELTNLAGSIVGSADIPVPANGDVATFLNQISGFTTLPAPFRGVLRLTSNATALSITGLRARYNERGDFLITTTSPFDESDPAVSTPAIFPHLAVGGGYSTQFILLNNPPSASRTGVIRFQSSAGFPLDLILR